MYGSLFINCSEAAFSNYRMWESAGFIIGYSYSGFLCVRVKIYVLLSVLAISAIGYIGVEVFIKVTTARKEKAAAQNDDFTDIKDKDVVEMKDVNEEKKDGTKMKYVPDIKIDGPEGDDEAMQESSA